MAQQRVVVLTGAGISAESGIRTYRDGDGLWEEHRIEDVATPGHGLQTPFSFGGFIKTDAVSCLKLSQTLRTGPLLRSKPKPNISH